MSAQENEEPEHKEGRRKLSPEESGLLRMHVSQQVGDFLLEGRSVSFGHRRTLDIPPFSVYVRTATRPLDGAFQPTLDIASIDNVDEPGRGAFLIFMKEVEKLALSESRAVYVECVNNDGLSSHLSRHGYRLRDEGLSRSYFKTLQMLKNELEQSVEFI
jgi:hypothetical protein